MLHASRNNYRPILPPDLSIFCTSPAKGLNAGPLPVRTLASSPKLLSVPRRSDQEGGLQDATDGVVKRGASKGTLTSPDSRFDHPIRREFEPCPQI